MRKMSGFIAEITDTTEPEIVSPAKENQESQESVIFYIIRTAVNQSH